MSLLVLKREIERLENEIRRMISSNANIADLIEVKVLHATLKDSYTKRLESHVFTLYNERKSA